MLFPLFATVPDHRVTGRCTYPLADLLTIALLTYVCGGEDYVDMSEFALTRARDLGLLADCGDCSPSPDTFERLFSAVSPEEIERCLREHGRRFLDSVADKQVVIDGKKLRGVSPRSRGAKGDYLLHAYVSENHLLLGQVPVKDKGNELSALPGLLDKLDLSGAVVSLDAMGTQTDIARRIRQKEAHYLLAVKENQAGLLQGIREAFALHKPAEAATCMEPGHGRIETRSCRILPASRLDDPALAARWTDIKTLVEVSSQIDHGDRQTHTTRWFISDEDHPSAAYFNMLVRGHWAIENQLHWHLDVTFLEDASRARKGFAPQNLSLLRKIALQGVKAHNDKRSIRKRLFRAALSQDYLRELLLNFKF